VDGDLALLRRARGYAPLPLQAAHAGPPILAVGAHLKNTIALAHGQRAFLSQHIGDLETPEALRVFERVIADFLRLYDVQPRAIAHDLHPDYVSTQWARQAARSLEPEPRLVPVQHHHAHLAACLAEHALDGPALGVTWDGTGYGTDGTVWGGEFLLGDTRDFRRVAHLARFRLPGGQAAIREPRRCALGLLWELYGEQTLDRTDLAVIRTFTPRERRILGGMLASGVNTPVTTSAGRLFDGIAALLGIATRVTFEGQAAAALEFAAHPGEEGAYSFELHAAAPRVLDWRPALRELLADLGRGVENGRVAARVHNMLVAGIAAVARAIGAPRVALTGGCFQNRLLVERAARRLRAAGHEVLLHRQVPPNDGGVSFGQFGQLAVAAARLAEHDRAD
jgi:hydrogenase maturation protein HypF